MHDFSPFYTPITPGLFGLIFPFVLIVALFTIVLKGYALWYAARAGQKYWFVALLFINTVGILEIIYLLFFRPSAPYKHVVDNATKNSTPVDSSPPA